MSLYLKYRPKKVEELDLTSVREAFYKLIKSNEVAHAYLFTGPRGAGKTSSARILSRIVNCEKNETKLGEPCNECSACKSILSGGSLDFIEIDAASNRGIDDIRELKEKIRLAPAELKYKVYIIDEVHMLTTEAFNALLKTLEEPPAHAIFILCTTEAHKVPETIQSRCVSVGFMKATPDEMKRSFARVISGEGKRVSEEALDYLARSVDGSFRDGVKILDKVLSQTDQVELAQMEEAIMGVSGYSVAALTKALIERNSQVALDELHLASSRGVDLVYLIVTLMKELRNHVLAGESKELIKLVFNLDDVARKVAISPVPELLLEMVIIDWGQISDNQQFGRSGNQNGSKSTKQTIKDVDIKMESGSVKMQGTEELKSPWMQMKAQFLEGKKIVVDKKSDADDTIDEAIAIFS
ncbi:DNA polymerase III subunit gamma/tau [Candidatus Microgenomates bacterium]|nr:DNA polymerase III subunit gamma/tau [Candidatus Microgenomates bacterium CPR3]RIK52051.1 MAG: DNA polymerase III subunit gamma/tau [Candidatus Microgenomates bacterium]